MKSNLPNAMSCGGIRREMDIPVHQYANAIHMHPSPQGEEEEEEGGVCALHTVSNMTRIHNLHNLHEVSSQAGTCLLLSTLSTNRLAYPSRPPSMSPIASHVQTLFLRYLPTAYQRCIR